MTTDAGAGRVIGTVVAPRDRRRADVTSFHLASDDLAVEIWDLGARLVELRAPDAHGAVANVVLRHPTLEDYVSDGHAYFGATIGRYANRIGRARIDIRGRTHGLDPNEGRHQLHGGPYGFDQSVWETVDASTGAVTFRHHSADGDQGFPGNATIEATYRVDGTRLTIETTASTDADTVMGTTNHAYWNLAGDGTIADHVLAAPATGVVEVDDELIPTGVIDAVDDGPFDFTNPTPLTSVVDRGGIDHCLVFDGTEASATLSHPSSGRSLSISSNQPGIQVYTGQYLPDAFAGVCLEPQQLPDTPNRPAFGSSLLRPGETYRHLVTYDFEPIPSIQHR